MKSYFVILALASLLEIALMVVGKKTDAQIANPGFVGQSGALDVEARTNDPARRSIFLTGIPPGYRDWKLISIAREEGTLDDIRAILGNDIALKAYREGTLPFPDGSMIARLAWSFDPSEENNRTF